MSGPRGILKARLRPPSPSPASRREERPSARIGGVLPAGTQIKLGLPCSELSYDLALRLSKVSLPRTEGCKIPLQDVQQAEKRLLEGGQAVFWQRCAEPSLERLIGGLEPVVRPKSTVAGGEQSE